VRRPRSQVALAVVTLLLGFLVVVQLRAQQAGTVLETQSSQDLTLLVANVTTRNDQLRGDVADLQRQLDAIGAARAGGETAVGELRTDLERVRLWAGIDAASGPGIRVLVLGGVPGTAVSDLLNELRNAGAEAISIGDVRVVAGTVVAGPAGDLSVENTALGPRVEIMAIGNPAALTGALTRVGGIVAQLQATYEDAQVEVTPVDSVVVPATERTLLPTLGKPRP
jgi:uncharacterized protein YlxW (UPF0749 family)